MPRSVMEHSFSRAPTVDIPRSSFNRSHGHKTTFDADYLIPVLVDPILPGDSLALNMSFIVRLNTLLWPLLDNLVCESFFFFVPNRLVWENWEKFMGARTDPADPIDTYSIPKLDSNTTFDLVTNGNRNLQYMGLPWISSIDLSEISALPFRGLNLIWNEWFRDQNLQDSEEARTSNGPDSHLYYPLLKRGKRHDYFTSCLTAPQKGDSVDLPLGTVSPIIFTGANNDEVLIRQDGTPTNHFRMDTAGGLGDHVLADGPASGLSSNLFADLSEATAATINELRQAFQIQRLLEKDARSGTRYRELLLAHFRVDNADHRLQRPEFLGGGSTPIQVNQVASTATIGSRPYIGDLGAWAMAADTHGFTKSFTEHGYLFGIINVRGDITYQQGIERHFFDDTRYDFYWPSLAHLGEMAVLNREIYYTNTSTDDDVFGYQEAYAHLRYKPSRISGRLSSLDTLDLDEWHLSEEFTSLPTLGATFIESNTRTPLDRAIALPAEPQFQGDFYFNMKHARPMPVFGIPGLIDHF